MKRFAARRDDCADRLLPIACAVIELLAAKLEHRVDRTNVPQDRAKHYEGLTLEHRRDSEVREVPPHCIGESR